MNIDLQKMGVGERKGEIIVSCNTYNNDYAVVTVKDSDHGIDSEILPKLFTKFASKSKNGTGPGLFICKNIIESFGGRIWIKNDKDDVIKNQQDFSKHNSQANTNNNNNKETTIAFSIPLIDSYSINENNELKKRTIW